ncbi:hypothetical protein [Maribacter luteus]|uniref:Uncharacterized protein n=1 Tax=Maribacter luteus TaxID=2594478 RepID=A0A6I2MIF8_9FLAO|nr:hypothetical protein [Maribacter luteus]MRX62932.1 hypothetical protein [Maribacter luteus]
MLSKTKGFYLITSNPLAENCDFNKKDGYYEKSIGDREKSIKSAYIVHTKAKYKDFVFTISQDEVLKDEHKVRLNLNTLDFAAYDYFGFPYRKDDASIVVQEDEIEEIWEERTPLARFPFKVDKIKYIKKEGKFL